MLRVPPAAPDTVVGHASRVAPGRRRLRRFGKGQAPFNIENKLSGHPQFLKVRRAAAIN
jgi:hypothetical protein